MIRLSAGRTDLSAEAQALCFMAGAGSIFCGDQRCSPPPIPAFDDDMGMFDNLGIKATAGVDGAWRHRGIAATMRRFDDIPDDYESVIGTWELTAEDIIAFARNLGSPAVPHRHRGG